MEARQARTRDQFKAPEKFGLREAAKCKDGKISIAKSTQQVDYAITEGRTGDAEEARFRSD